MLPRLAPCTAEGVTLPGPSTHLAGYQAEGSGYLAAAAAASTPGGSAPGQPKQASAAQYQQQARYVVPPQQQQLYAVARPSPRGGAAPTGRSHWMPDAPQQYRPLQHRQQQPPQQHPPQQQRSGFLQRLPFFGSSAPSGSGAAAAAGAGSAQPQAAPASAHGPASARQPLNPYLQAGAGWRVPLRF